VHNFYLTAQACNAQIDDNDEQIDVVQKEITIKEMNEMFRIAEILKEKILNDYPNLEQSAKVHQETENSIRCYGVLYEGKRKTFHQTTLHQFLSKKE
jgi:7-keto-8-aminopelargonate synthetase-like enzyme